MSNDPPASGPMSEATEKSALGEMEKRLSSLSLKEEAALRVSALSRRSFDRSKSPNSDRTGNVSPVDRSSQQTLGSAAFIGGDRRAHSPQAGSSPFSFPNTSSASSTPVGTPTMPSVSLPFTSGGSSSGRSGSISAPSPTDPFNFAGSPSLSNRPLEAAKHQHHRSRSINMGGYSPVMKGGKLINFGGGPVSISGPSGESGSSDGSGSSNPGSPLSSSPAGGQGLAAGFDPSALGPGFNYSFGQSLIGSTAPRAPSPLQQSHLASPSAHQMDTDGPGSSNGPNQGSSTSPTIPPLFSSSPSSQNISHSHRDSRTIDFNTAAKGWESPSIQPTSLPLPIPIGQYSLSSLRAAAAASERARSPKPLSLGEPQITPSAMVGASLPSPDAAGTSSSPSANTLSGSSSHGPTRKASGASLGRDAILASPKFKNATLTSTSASHPAVTAAASVAASAAGLSAALPVISRPISPHISGWPSSGSTVSPGSSPSNPSAFHFPSSSSARLGRPASPAVGGPSPPAQITMSRGRTPSPSRVAGREISRQASLSPPLDADAQMSRFAPSSPSNWNSTWPEAMSGGASGVGSSSRAMPIGLSSSPHGRNGGVRLERGFSSGSNSSGGSPGTSPSASSSSVFAAAAGAGLGLGSAAWKFPSSPRSSGDKMLNLPPRQGRGPGSASSRSRSPSPAARNTNNALERSKSQDSDEPHLRAGPSSPIAIRAEHASTSPRDLFLSRTRSTSSSSSSSSQGSDGANGSEELSLKLSKTVPRAAHARTVSVDRAHENGSSNPRQSLRSSSGGRHNRKTSDPIPASLKSPPSAMRIAHGSAKTEVDARQALSENTKGKAGIAGGLITDEVDALSEQLPPPAIPARIPSDHLGSLGVDDSDPLSRPASSTAGPGLSPAGVLGGATASLNQLVRPTPVDGRLLPAFGASSMARSGSGNSVTNALGLGADSITGGLHSPHNPFGSQMPVSPRMGAAPLPMGERTLLGLRSRSPSPASMLSPSPFDPLRRQSPSPSPLSNAHDAMNGESPPKMRSFIGMPPRSGYELSDDPDDVGSEGDASSASSADGREGSIGGGDEDGMDEKEDSEHSDDDARRLGSAGDAMQSEDDDEEESQVPLGSRRALRGLPSEITRSTLFARRQNASSSSSDGDIEDNREGDAEDGDGREQRRNVRESRAPSPPTDQAEVPSRPSFPPRPPSLTRSNAVPPPPELRNDDEEQVGVSASEKMKSVLGFFHGDDPESQLDESSDWGAPLSRQVGNSRGNLHFVNQEDEDGDTSLSQENGDWAPPSSQGMATDGDGPSTESEEPLTTLERIFLFAKSEMTYHRILVSQCLAEWILDVKLSDAVEYIIPLLNGLSTDEHDVCEAFSPELHRIMWFFFRNCPLKQIEAQQDAESSQANGEAHVIGTAEETAIRPQLGLGTFTPLLCALLLNQNSGIARSTQNAIVQFCSRLHRDSEGALLSEDGSWSADFAERCEGDHTFLIGSTVDRDGKDIAYEPYHFGPKARQIVEQEILQNVAIAIGSLNAHNPLEGKRLSTDATDHSTDIRAALTQGDDPSKLSGLDADNQEAEGASSQGTSSSEPGEGSREESSWDPESQLDSQMEDVWRSDGGLFDASSPQMGSLTRGEFDEEAAVARMAGISMLAALAAEGIIHVDIITNTFVPQMVGLQKDPAFFVRKEVAVSLGILAKAVTNESVVKESLLPALDVHLHDNIWHVRQAACLSMPAVLAKTDNETQRSRAVSYLRHLVADVSRNVKSAALETIGELVFLFHEKPGGVPEELIRFFLGEPIDGPDEEMADGNKEQDGPSQSRFELSNVTSDFGFADALQFSSESAWGGGMGMHAQIDMSERAVVTAFNFPAVVFTMGAEHWPRLKALHAELSQDMTVKVRRSLASSLHEVAKIIGPEATQTDLLPIFDRFLQDNESEIKTAVVENIDIFLAQLPQEHALAELRSMQDRWLNAFGRDWRLRERLAQHISPMADSFLLSDEDANLIALMQLAIADPVSAVRDAGVVSIAKMYNIFSEHDQAAADGFLALVDDLGNSSSYRIRVASLMAIEGLIHGTIQRAALETILLERLVAAADDDVIDVRIVLARCVSAMCQKDELYGLTQSRGPALLELISKLARDVSAEVRQPIQTLLTEEDAEIAEKEAQENLAQAPKSSTRILVLGPKDGGPHREARSSTFSAMAMDQSADLTVDEDMPVFAMDEDVTDQAQAAQTQLQNHAEQAQLGFPQPSNHESSDAPGDVTQTVHSDDDGDGPAGSSSENEFSMNLLSPEHSNDYGEQSGGNSGSDKDTPS